MTEEIFRHDAYARTAEAQVVAVGEDGIELDRTIFYPEGGGQPSDQGTVSGVAVVDVRKSDDGIRHVLAGPRPAGSRTHPGPPAPCKRRAPVPRAPGSLRDRPST